MHPVLLKLGPFSIHTYGFFIAMGFIAGILLAKREAKRLGEDPERIMDLSFYLLIAAIVGSRLFYIFINPEIFVSDILESFRIWNGGLVFYGGFIAALIVGLIYLKIKKMPLWRTMDIAAPSLALGQFFGRLGCFSAGCCYGKACDLPWAVTFTNPDTLAPIGIPIHPTQLYQALGNLSIFAFLWFFRTRKKFDGHLFWMYVMLYAIIRSFIEIFRGDFRGEPIFGVLSVAQAIGIIMVPAAVIMMIILKKQKQAGKTL
ncbi:MAG: prolipoprotein diacylglyceryl transferase [Desulfobacterales bacterium]|uniref:Phosphatidylglycerol--prolipoprotein diacylglyceryl transferase n=1 Tax=Candidatus Desulfaltia bathyphila TaxID=2841697 RepID=A0A8J6N597_9BACT|nr:prolipoprotein diacylglyceryl transferase [Candidatus Desulfaltia bathyphila]MBL7208398.1 prolipoprotein diacylglyceryl transferase [Desulfobacterales bacterium]